jgi:DNA-binding transcriptional ArsR family regulator
MSAKAKQTKGLVDQRLVKALGHPLRQRILQELRDEERSPNELAEALGEPLGNVSYHVKILAECDAVELVRTAPVRGALEHFYRARALPRLYEAEWQALHPATRRALFNATLAQIWDHVVDASRGGGFENTKSHVSWTPLEFDDKAYAKFLNEIETFVDRAMALQAQSEDRLAKQAPEDRTVHSTELVMMHFHRNSGTDPGSGGRRRRKHS